MLLSVSHEEQQVIVYSPTVVQRTTGAGIATGA
jgi:hypothetical protein